MQESRDQIRIRPQSIGTQILSGNKEKQLNVELYLVGNIALLFL